MTITKGSREAHERSVKAAATRARNRASGVRTVPVTTHVPRGGSRNVKKMTMNELTGEFTRLRNAPGSNSNRYYRIKDEIRARYSKAETGETNLERGIRLGKEYRAAQKAKKQRASAKKKNPAAHRKDLEGATRRLEYAYDEAKTPTAKRKIRARLTRLYKEMNTRPEYN